MPHQQAGRPDPALRRPNRLIREKSPYLLQHAHNPVDWYPWGEEAFARAREEDKPILLSIGYSTCHWCHVMERESFEDPEIAAVMNRHLVCVKLDREERPDLDRIYMTAVQAMTGAGGWPLNVFLTPDLKPFFGGTYFPPDARWGRPGWPDIVERVGRAWRDPEQRKTILASAGELTEGLGRFLAAPREEAPYGPELLSNAAASFQASHDRGLGGFGPAPKFPMPVNQHFLFRYYAFARQGPDAAQVRTALDMALHTLRCMARGGIYDHLGGGFARYSTDERWHVPHFEKMLYDNAQLLVNFLEAHQITGDPFFARVARETLEYVRRDMTHPEGGFYSAEDADSLPAPGAPHKAEGAFYVWENDEVLNVLGPVEGEVFCFHYGVEPDGNVLEDPHGEFPRKNVLFAAREPEETGEKFGLRSTEVEALLARAREKLLAARARRPRPHLDDKILTSWNGLMISAFARAHQVLGGAEYLDAARRAAAFLKKNLYDPGAKRLYRRWRDGERQVEGLSDDHAFLAQGLLDLYEAGFDADALSWAEELAESLLDRFYDARNGGFYMTAEAQDPSLLLRTRDEQDNVEPSAASVAVLTLLRLAQATGREDFRQAAEKTLRAFAAAMQDQPRALPCMLSALAFALTPPRQIVVAGDPRDPGARRLLETVHGKFLPHKILILANGGQDQEALVRRLPFLKSLPPAGGKPTAYVCVDHACQLPTSDPAALAQRLESF